MAQTKSSLQMDNPIPFIIVDDNGKFSINKDVQKLLQNQHTTVSCISIVGKYRTGKSYLLNRFFGRNSGFDLGGAIQAKTKGIWIWVKPHPVEENRLLILLDTEGLHDVEKGDETNDIQLFSFALLLSTCLVYNATGTLDDVIIQQLNLVSSLTENIKINEANEEDGNHFNRYFPSFYLVLRDFFLKLEINGKACTPDDYLENSLKLKKGTGKKIAEYNMPRECIQAFFPNRRCFVLGKPVDDDAKLVALDEVSDEEIRPKFLEDVHMVITEILSDSAPMQVDGHIITASRYVQLAETYVDAFNNGAIPCISNALDLLKYKECRRALEEAIKLYDSTLSECLNGLLPVSQEEMSSTLKSAHTIALDHYCKQAIFDKEGEYVNKLTEEMEAVSKKHIDLNNEASREKCKEVIKKSFSIIEEKTTQDAYTCPGGFTQYTEDRDKAMEMYESEPNKGPLAEEVLNEYIQGCRKQESTILNADKALSEKERELMREKEERRRKEEEVKVARERQQRLIQEMTTQQENHVSALMRLQQDYSEQHERLLEEHKQDLAEKEKQYSDMVKEGLHKQAGQYQELIDDMKHDKEAMERNYQNQVKQMEEFRQIQESMIKEMKNGEELNMKKVQMLEEKLKEEENVKSGIKVFGIFSKLLSTFSNMYQARALNKHATALEKKGYTGMSGKEYTNKDLKDMEID